MDISDNLSLSHVEVTVPTTFLFTFVGNVHPGFELIFFSRVNELFNSIEIEIVIVRQGGTLHGSRVPFALALLGINNYFNYSL